MPDPPLEPSPVFSSRLTLVYSLLVAVLISAYVLSSPATPLDLLDRPEESLERLVSREMDFRDAVRMAPRWERTLYAVLGVFESDLDEPIAWYDELVESTSAPLPHLYRAILLAESGSTDRLPGALATSEFQGELGSRMAEWLRAAYLPAAPDEEGERMLLEEIREWVPPGWFADVLVARLAARIGESAAEMTAQSAIAGRGAVLLQRWRGLMAAQLSLLAIGAWMIVSALRRIGPVAGAPLPPPWGFLDGYGLFIRGVSGFLAVSVLALLVPPALPLESVTTLASGVPMLAWTWRYLVARGQPVLSTFGLLPGPGGGAPLAVATLALIALQILGEGIMAVAFGAFPLRTHWAEGLSENLLWGPAWLVALDVLDSSVWTPLVEEIAFRGVLYGALRTRTGPWPAAIGSAIVFAAAHDYSVLGFAAVLWSGLMWAYFYERTRSLLPAILAHSANNAAVTAIQLWLLRM